ncbi:hypothetical protein [Streptomyces sp. NPDC047009]|uniref:SCO2400 family protein n=1 Tax=Streptomyces sp. NPDC047009 TaxID=3154496 RepID=UPI0033E978F9
MDYCHPCRRHLNGALACPGCGTPVEELHAYAAAEEEGKHPDGDGYEGYDGTDGSEEPEVPYEDEPARPGRSQGRRRSKGRVASGDGDGAPEGRAGRRDRKAAAHRRRRRRVLFVGAGLLLAAGALSLAELGIEAPGTTPKTAAAGDATADGGASVKESTAMPDGGDATSISASTSASPSESAKGKKDDKKKADKETPSPTATVLPTRTVQAPQPAPSSTPSSAPATKPPSASPTPRPSPTKTCNRFLWWCT